MFSPSSYLLPNSSSETFPIKPVLFPSWDKPTIEFATDPPETVFSILRVFSKLLNSFTTQDKKIYWECSNCSVKFLDKSFFIDKEAEKQRYLEHQNEIGDPSYIKFLSKLSEPLERKLKPEDHGLDFGCGHGPALATMFKDKGFKIDLYDYNTKNDINVKKESREYYLYTKSIFKKGVFKIYHRLCSYTRFYKKPTKGYPCYLFKKYE